MKIWIDAQILKIIPQAIALPKIMLWRSHSQNHPTSDRIPQNHAMEIALPKISQALIY